MQRLQIGLDLGNQNYSGGFMHTCQDTRKESTHNKEL
jgi:hypothetical protein